MKDPKRFVIKLRDQLRFLQRSAKVFDDGDQAESQRLACSLRILFHKTGHSTSILGHLNWNDIPMLSSFADGHILDFVKFRIDPSLRGGVLANPQLRPRFNIVAASAWWEVEFVKLGSAHYSRKKIITTAANQDGGAHVDATVDEFYEDLAAGIPL